MPRPVLQVQTVLRRGDAPLLSGGLEHLAASVEAARERDLAGPVRVTVAMLGETGEYKLSVKVTSRGATSR